VEILLLLAAEAPIDQMMAEDLHQEDWYFGRHLQDSDCFEIRSFLLYKNFCPGRSAMFCLNDGQYFIGCCLQIIIDYQIIKIRNGFHLIFCCFNSMA
jgi:hypothetical protein